MATEKEIAQIIGLISAAYPNWSPTDLTAEVYYQVLHDLDAEELKAAALQCVSENGRKFAPSVGELRGAVADLRRAYLNIPSAYSAWQEVLQQITDVGSYRTPQFTHPLIDRAVRSLGWRNICLSENSVADRARFLQFYEQLQHRAETEDMMIPQVRGYIEANGGIFLDAPSQMKELAARLQK